MYKNKKDYRKCVCRLFYKSGQPVNRVFDVAQGQSYEVNSHGFLRNDFAVLNESNDALTMARVLSRMQEITANDVDNTNRSFEDIVREVKPRWCQTPAELDKFEQYCIENAIDWYKQFDTSTETAPSEVVESTATE